MERWKSSNDPNFVAKMHRVLALYDTPPTDGRVSAWTSSGR
ncbi:hypothetical protein [Streptomyces gobiensis]|nr:hypothetical protein [Streptomyces gobiensis]